MILRLGGFEGGNEELPDRFRLFVGGLEDPESNGTLEDSQNAKRTLEDSNEIDGTSKILGKGLNIKELDEKLGEQTIQRKNAGTLTSPKKLRASLVGAQFLGSPTPSRKC